MVFSFKDNYSDYGLEKEKIESSANVNIFLSSLSKKQRIIFKLKENGYTNSEIAEKIKSSRSSVERWLKKMRKSFKENY
jgi:RNA polymerase sigma factor (sigma-70 family)